MSTWSAGQLHEHLGEVSPHPRTIDRLRQRHGLTRQLKRPAPTQSIPRFTPEAQTQARHLIETQAALGPHRLAGDLCNADGIRMSPTPMKRLKRAVHIERDPSPIPVPVPILTPPPAPQLALLRTQTSPQPVAWRLSRKGPLG